MTSKRSLIALVVLAIGIGILVARLKNAEIPVQSRPNTSSGSDTPAAPASGWLARVGEETITVADVDWEAALHTTVPQIVDDHVSANSAATPSPKDEGVVENSDSLRHRLLVTMIERKLLYQWIKGYSEGFDHENPSRFLSCLSETKELADSVKDAFGKPESRERLKAKLCERSLIDQYLSEKVVGSIKVTDAEIASYYRTHTEEFKQPQRAVFLQILLPTEAAANALKPKVNRSNFAELAASHSIAPEAKEGGKLGPFRRDQLPTFFDIVFNMQIGEISGIVRSSYGFHIIMPLERLPPKTLSLMEARPTIIRQLQAVKKQDLFQAWLTTAMNTIPVRSNIGEENP